MPIFIAALIGGLVSAAGSIAGRVLIALGVGIAVYQGVDIVLEEFRTIFMGAASGLGTQLGGMLGVLKIGTGFNILMSACVARLTLNGLTSGTLKRLVLK